MQDTLLAEITRGQVVESQHFGAYVVADATGAIVAHGGNFEDPIFPRSAVKALQALPLVATGAADRLGLTAAELALACASHAGEPAHIEIATAMLAKAGRDFTCLECGAHWPSSRRAMRALAAAGQSPSALHNNCSGKHSGFVCTAIAQNQDPTGYIAATHPTMAQVTRALSIATGTDLSTQTPATDGCSIPTYQFPMASLATGFARFATAAHLPQDFADAAIKLRAAIAQNPFMVAGTERFDTVVMQALGAKAFVKTGAEGVYCAALPDQGLGIALKCRDGATRAAEAAMAAVLTKFLGPHDILSKYTTQTLTNWNGLTIGEIRAPIPT